MGYTILLQWTFTPPAPTQLTDLILARVLDHHRLAHPTRATLQVRTYRASFPSSAGPHPARILTTILPAPPQPLTSERDPPAPDDVGYLFLEDRAGPPNPSSEPPVSVAEDAFELLSPAPAPAPTAISESFAYAYAHSYRVLAVRPAGNLLPVLHSVLSPFVLGLTKSARAAASTTSQSPIPTPLPGQPTQLTTLSFPALPPPYPAIALRVHVPPSPAALSIFLEAEYPDASDPAVSGAVLREFLHSCLPEGVRGERRFVEWEGDRTKLDEGGWEGVERTRRTLFLLAKCLREGGYI